MALFIPKCVPSAASVGGSGPAAAERGADGSSECTWTHRVSTAFQMETVFPCHILLDLVSYLNVYLWRYLWAESLRCFGYMCCLNTSFLSPFVSRGFVCAHYQLLQEIMKIIGGFAKGWTICRHLPFHCTVFPFNWSKFLHWKSICKSINLLSMSLSG